jgi:ribosomal protein S12 methylthiotransferase accessory factor
MEMDIYFPGKKKVFADYKGFTIETDQPEAAGGDDSAPAPFDLFVASIGTCAGIFVLDFMQRRDIPTEGAKLTLRGERDPETRLVSKMRIEIQLPPGFPVQYKDAVVRAAELCSVKRHIHQPPHFEIEALDYPEGD